MDFSSNASYPRGMRDNNPLNVATVPGMWNGETSVDTNPQREAIFSDMTYGIRAATILLYNYYII